MYMIEIETKEMEKASEYVEKALKYMGKVMQCISSWEEEAGYGNRYGERGGMNYRDGEDYRRSMMGSRGGSMGYREDDDDDEMNERRGVRGSGRGRRY